MYAQRVPLLADELPEQQSSHHSPLGDEAEAVSDRDRSVLAGCDRLEESMQVAALTQDDRVSFEPTDLLEDHGALTAPKRPQQPQELPGIPVMDAEVRAQTEINVLRGMPRKAQLVEACLYVFDGMRRRPRTRLPFRDRRSDAWRVAPGTSPSSHFRRSTAR